MNKKLVFTLFVSVGNIAGSLIVYFLLGAANVPAYVALYTSIITASYTILAEPKQKTEPILRINPLVSQNIAPVMFNFNVDVWVENIGYGIAKNIEAKISISNTEKFTKDFTQRLLAPKEITKFSVYKNLDFKFYEEQITIELTFSNEDDKKAKPLIEKFRLRDLPEGLREVKVG